MLIVVTGASRGIGRAVSEQFVREGHTVIAVTRSGAQGKNIAGGGKLIAVTADVSSSAGRDAVEKSVRENGGQLSTLINNAAGIVKKPFADITLQDLESVFGSNVHAPFLLTQQLLPHFAKPAHVVNIGSMGGVQGSAKFEGLSAYSASKGALAILTECMALELSGQGISVNCLALGAVQTEMLAEAFPGYTTPVTPEKIAAFICRFAQEGHVLFNGKIIPVSASTP